MDVIRYTITGLRSSDATFRNVDESQTTTLSMPKDASVLDLYRKIEATGFDRYITLSNDAGANFDIHNIDVVAEPYDEICIVEQRIDSENSISVDEPLINFANRRYRKLEINIGEEATVLGNSVDCLTEKSGLEIKFLRTIRMPDDNKLHALPPATGTFPLFNVSAYEAALPQNIAKEGGVFFPMWQREALWISFNSSRNMQYAIRVALGRINAITGASMDEPSDEQLQDYVVVPGQDWLDGICVGPGKVRQFVAMPLGSGYTVEGQKTQEEKHGGLQIEIIPAFRRDLRYWMKSANAPEDAVALNEHFRDRFYLDTFMSDEYTPGDLHLKVGDVLRSYPNPPTKSVPRRLVDIVGDEKEVLLKAIYPKRKVMGRPYGASYSGDFFGSPANTATQAAPKAQQSLGITNTYPYATPTSIHDNSASVQYSPALTPAASTHFGFDECASGNAMMTQPCEGSVLLPDEALPEGQPQIDIKAMGIAAGGLLIQDIYEDKNDSAIWNTAASKLINVHILDPDSCEAVTHIVPQPPPQSVEGYAESGGAFYVVEEKPDERLDSGDFDNVKSVSTMDNAKGVEKEQSLDPTKPTQCKCGVRLCDCVLRPCNHQFCHICVKEVDSASSSQRTCPICNAGIERVAGFSAPMNLPGEETLKIRVPVNLLEVNDGRMTFKSVAKSRI